MKARDLFISMLAMCVACSTPSESSNGASPDPDGLGAGVHVIRGMIEPGRQPDGNTVVLDARDGLVVFDTGRHASHTQKIIDYARERRKPVIAIFNSHWHLDHISGNRMLRDVFPKAAIYSSDAALTEAFGSFLARGAESNRRIIAEGTASASQVEEARTDLAAVEDEQRLRPTIPIEKTQTLTISGRKIEAHFAKGASSGDVWLYDPQARLAMSGDLITLPAPFFDTACPIAWKAGLDELLLQPFERAVPGHGRVMTRADVTIYRDAFNALVACARGTAEAAACSDAWATSVASLLDGPEADGRAARGFARYYVEELFRKGAKRADCPE